MAHIDGHRIRAHRLSYLAFVGEIPNGALILHRCDHKQCVRPEHLEVGNHSDNLKQAWDRLRQRKVTDAVVRTILASNDSAPRLSIQLGISQTSVKNVRRSALGSR